MKGEDLLMVIAIVAVLVSVIAAGVTYFSVANLVTRISGFATGEANLTIESSAAINFTSSSINWSTGAVTTGFTFATLTTTGAGSVTNGNWTADNGFVIQNIGNNNVTLNISVGKTAANFIGGTGVVYQWNVSENASAAGACLNETCGTDFQLAQNDTFEKFRFTNTTSTTACMCFPFTQGNDTIRIDFNVTIPEDATTGNLGDVLTATITAIT